ncbi:MAG: ECF transporter S component [Dehalococcoidia bacterium]|nr:ECF transporter S component [Dehalococcoidia bacterium]
MRKSHIFLGLVLVMGLAIVLLPVLSQGAFDLSVNWGLISGAMVVLMILAFFLEFQETATSSKEIAVVAMLGTLSAVLRIPFAAIPSVQPSTYLIICTGYVFGPVSGFMVGALTALVSDLFLGLGPWTPLQMVAWGLAGVSAGYMRRFNLNRFGLVALGVAWGYLFGLIMDSWFWASFVYPLTFRSFVAAKVSGLWFDSFHAIGNAIFLGVFGLRTIAILERFRKRFFWGRLQPDRPADA